MEIQEKLLQPKTTWNKIVKNEKTLEKYEKFYLKNEARHGEATAKEILQSLKDKGCLHTDYKLNPKRIGRKMAEQPWFKPTKKYDKRTQQDRIHWRYVNR